MNRPTDRPTSPLAIDLYCGLGGWTEGLMMEGYRVVGFDNERHVYGDAQYPASLVLQDVLTIHGAQFRSAALIVASPPCQAYSYRAMPWKRAKALPPPDNTLFEACFRIQQEASIAAGSHIPLVVENVCGAQKWVGRARWHFGSFYLWGDVPALMPITRRSLFRDGSAKVGGFSWDQYGQPNYKARAFNGTADQRRRATKNDGGSWFNVAHNTVSGHGQNPDGRKSNGSWFGVQDQREQRPRRDLRDTSASEGRKGYAAGTGNLGKSVISRTTGSGTVARRAASAHIAKIPLPLARWIGRAWYPSTSIAETLTCNSVDELRTEC